jgi:hypothetical protein
MKIKYNIPILSDREARYNSVSFLFRTNKKWMFTKLYNRDSNRLNANYYSTNVQRSRVNQWLRNSPEDFKASNIYRNMQDYEYQNFYSGPLSEIIPHKYLSKNQRRQLINPVKEHMYDVHSYRTSLLNSRGERELHCPRPSIGQRHKEDPLFELLRKQVEDYLIPLRTAKGDYGDNLVKWDITFRYTDGDATISLARKASGFYIDGIKMVKEDVISALAKIILRAIYVRSEEVLMDYVEKVTTIPYNVLYALENRTPYHYYDYGERKDVKIDTKLISNTEVALQISDGIWAAMSVIELNRFISFYRHGKKRAKKWVQISPRNLWKALLEETPTSSQEKMMLAWLSQNRTEKIVEQRAEKLLLDLDNEYPQITFMHWPNEETNALHIRGKVCDWIVSANRGMKRGHQDVSTYRVGKPTDTVGGASFQGHALSHSICIDNLHNNSTANDQLAARAMVLLNDKAAKSMIYTLSGLLEEAENDHEWQYQARVSDKLLRKLAREVR